MVLQWVIVGSIFMTVGTVGKKLNSYLHKTKTTSNLREANVDVRLLREKA